MLDDLLCDGGWRLEGVVSVGGVRGVVTKVEVKKIKVKK